MPLNHTSDTVPVCCCFKDFQHAKFNARMGLLFPKHSWDTEQNEDNARWFHCRPHSSWHPSTRVFWWLVVSCCFNSGLIHSVSVHRVLCTNTPLAHFLDWQAQLYPSKGSDQPRYISLAKQPQLEFRTFFYSLPHNRSSIVQLFSLG